MMVLIYGYSLIYIISGFLSYNINAIQALGIGVLSCAIRRYLFRTWRRSFGVLGVFAFILVIASFILYKLNLLTGVVMQINDFIKVYYLSVEIETVSIDLLHQTIVLMLIGIIAMAVLNQLINNDKRYSIYLVIASIVLIVFGFMSKTMGSAKDREAFMILSGVMILYYFFVYHKKYKKETQQLYPWSATIILFVAFILAGGVFLYSIESTPWTKPPGRRSFRISPEVASEHKEMDKVSYYNQLEFSIQDSFDYEGIRVLDITTEDVKYLKGQTYETYESGVWYKNEGIVYLENEGDAIQKLEEIDPLEYTNYYKLNDVEIKIGNMNTNIMFVGNYWVTKINFQDGISVMNDPRRGIFFSNNLLWKDFEYRFQSVVPNYGGRELDGLIQRHSNEQLPADFGDYVQMPGEGYDDLKALAEEIVDGIDNKYDQARAIEQHLKHNYLYNEMPEINSSADREPINDFLFESREGFCQQFATSFILMARSLGIPTRYVSGFYVDIAQAQSMEEAYYMMSPTYVNDGYISVYDSDAHTWAEAYFPKVGWIMFEPTPGKSYREDVFTPYDTTEDLTMDEEVEEVTQQEGRKNTLFLLLIIPIAFAFYLIYRWQRLSARLIKSDARTRLLTIHRMMRRYLKYCGFIKEPYETPREYARRIDDNHLVNNRSMLGLMDSYEVSVYGGNPINYESLNAHYTYMKAIRKYAKKHLNMFVYLGLRGYDFLNYRVKYKE